MTTRECIESLNLILECIDDKLHGESDKVTKLTDIKPSSFEFVVRETIDRMEELSINDFLL